MQKVIIIGAGKTGLALIDIVREIDSLQIVAIVDVDMGSPGMLYAQQHNIFTAANWRDFLASDIDIVIEATDKNIDFRQLKVEFGPETVVIPSSVAFIAAKLFIEKEVLIDKLQKETEKFDIVFNSTDEGMIVIDDKENIILFNECAEKMTGYKKENVIGLPIKKIIKDSQLPRVLHTRKIEVNQEFLLENEKKIITTRLPIINKAGLLLGAIAVFKDISAVVKLAEEITNIKEMETMLKAIFDLSDDAITVVDQDGNGLLINEAFTSLTGLKKEEALGRRIIDDPSLGGSLFKQVLKTRRPIKGKRIQIGKQYKEVNANVTPLFVDGKLRGSVGIIHDHSEVSSLSKQLKTARRIIRTLEAKYTFDDIIGNSEVIQFPIEQAKLAAKTTSTVLLRGEPGTGKELFAIAIHNESKRKFNRFVKVNCCVKPESDLQEQLFGTDDGINSTKGLMEEANGGSVFIDEIDKLSLSMQAKLLHILKENKIAKMGSQTTVPVDIRFIVSTTTNLERAIAAGEFLEELYYRLNIMAIQLPPLRQRLEDVIPLAQVIIEKLNQQYGRNVETITESALKLLMNYFWPGNVRELENIIGRAMIGMNKNEAIIQERNIHLFQPNKIPSMDVKKDTGEVQSLAVMLENYEAKIIKDILMKYDGNKTLAAKSLGISLRSLYYKLEKFGIISNV